MNNNLINFSTAIDVKNMVGYSVAVLFATSLSRSNNLQGLNSNSSEDLQFYLQQVKVEYKSN